MERIFAIPCKYSDDNPFIYNCIDSIRKYHNDKIVGEVTSGSYGYRVKKSLAFSYINYDFANGGSTFKIALSTP